jgi:Leucine-rich repeat (LRR) protein
LQRLNVDNNKLENLPDSIGCFTNLQELFLWGNPLKSLPDSISQLNLNAHSLDQIAEVKVRFGGRTIL